VQFVDGGSVTVMNDHDDVDALRERIGELEQQLEALQAELQTATNRDIPLIKGTVRSMSFQQPVVRSVSELLNEGNVLSSSKPA